MTIVSLSVLTAIYDKITLFFQSCQSFFEAIMNSINSLSQFISLLTSSGILVNFLARNVPSIISVCILAVVSIQVVKIILGAT